MAQRIPKRKIKDSVFTNLFQDKKYLLQLYQTLHPEDDKATEDEIADVTLNNVLIDADYNDLGFSVGDRLMVLVESQSTWTVNIIIRALMYLVQTYHEYFKRTDQNLYGSRKANLPKPELYVIYTGERENVPDAISLSKEFFAGEKVAVDVKVKVLYRANEKDIIGQYIIFSKVYDEQRNLHGRTKWAVTETIRICKNRNVLKEYLESKEQEVVDMMMTLFDEEQVLKAYTKEVADDAARKAAKEAAKEAAKAATEETERRTIREMAERMIKAKEMSLEKIAQYLPTLSMEELKEIESKIVR